MCTHSRPTPKLPRTPRVSVRLLVLWHGLTCAVWRLTDHWPYLIFTTCRDGPGVRVGVHLLHHQRRSVSRPAPPCQWEDRRTDQLTHAHTHHHYHHQHQTAAASDKCQQEKRKTINGDDLLWAMSTLGFDKYVEPLKLYLAKYREVRAFLIRSKKRKGRKMGGGELVFFRSKGKEGKWGGGPVDASHSRGVWCVL